MIDTKPTRRQQLAAADYLYGRGEGGRQRLSHADIAKKFGVKRSAISNRIRRFKAKLTGDALARYEQAIECRRGRRRRVNVAQLSVIENV